MDSLLSRHRNAVVLVAALFLQLVLLAFQVKRGKDVPLIRIWAVAVIAPVEKASSSVIRGLVGVWRDYVDLRHARQDNRRLIEEIGRLKLSHHHLQEEAREARRLKEVLQLGSQIPFSSIACRVIGSSASKTSRVLFLDKGSEVGIRPNMPVITPDGIVGKVHRVFWGTAQVLVITDPDSGVGALLEKSRVHGAALGSGGFSCQLAYVVNDQSVEVGERVLTSGEDLIYPKGLPIGTVTSVKPGRVFHEIQVQPSARLNQLEEVLVVVRGARQQIPSRAEGPVAAGASPRRSGATAMAAVPPVAAATTEPEDGPAAVVRAGNRPETDADKLLEAYRTAQVHKGKDQKRALAPPQPRASSPIVVPKLAEAPEPAEAPKPAEALAPATAEVEAGASSARPGSQPVATTVPAGSSDKRLPAPESPPQQ
jgi:rod shape-determining protein MreC